METPAPSDVPALETIRNQTEDITQAISVTATGKAFPVTGIKREPLLALYLSRHPHMKSFADDPTTAVVCMTVNAYIMVSQFQTVVEIKVGS